MNKRLIVILLLVILGLAMPRPSHANTGASATDTLSTDTISGRTERVSVDSTGAQANGHSSYPLTQYPAISADGRFIAFTSSATNLVPGDTNNAPDIFVHDRLTGATTRVSIDSAGNQADRLSAFPTISADGRFVAFQSVATNLVADDTNNFTEDVFVHDRQTGTTERVSVNSAGAQATGDSPSFESTYPAISADGRVVAFTSSAINLVPSDTNNFSDIFIHDRQTGTTERASVDSAGTQANAGSRNTAISADGRVVAFASPATNLVAGGNVPYFHIYVHDRQIGTTERVSVDSAGTQANGNSSETAISADGRVVAFYSYATNLVAGDTNNFADIFLHDRLTGTTERVSVGIGGQANQHSFPLDISGDGRFVAFATPATNLVVGDTNGIPGQVPDVFVRDRQSGTTWRVSVGSAGNRAYGSLPAISADGRFVAFISGDPNLVADDTNGFIDIFVHDRNPSPPPPDNDAPVLGAIGDQAVDEGSALTFTASATDADLPADTLTYSLIGAPEGASIDSSSGAFNWTPSEVQGPGSYTFKIRVTDSGDPALLDEEELTVTVSEVNQAPALVPIGDQNMMWGNALAFTASASDMDLPANTLTYSLVDAPSGATIDSSTGAFSWTPTSAQIGAHTLTVRVSDNGSPVLIDEKTITIAVGKRATQFAYGGDSAGQYSDAVTVTATLTDNGGGALQGQPIAGKPVNFIIGDQSAQASTQSTGLAQGSLVLNQPAATPGVGASFAEDALYLGSSDSDPFELKQEDATIAYSGETLKTTPGSESNSTVSVNLAAVIREAADSSLGSLLPTTQLVFSVFKFSDTAMTIPVASCTALVGATTAGAGTASCAVTLGADTYTVKIALVSNGYYKAPVETQAITVAQPGSGFTTGGGWLDEPNLGSRSNFGFTVKYLNNGNIQGKSLYIYRVTADLSALASPPAGAPTGMRAYNWIIKSNAMDALAQSCMTTPPTVCTATFTGKNTITAVDRETGAAYSLGGNYTFQVDVTDASEPGSSPGAGPDSYAIRVWDSASGTYYQLGRPDAQVAINGGNIQVHP